MAPDSMKNLGFLDLEKEGARAGADERRENATGEPKS